MKKKDADIKPNQEKEVNVIVEAKKETPKVAPKETPKDAPKETPKDAPMQVQEGVTVGTLAAMLNLQPTQLIMQLMKFKGDGND